MPGTEAEGIKPLKKRRKNGAGSGDERMDLDQPPMLEQGPALDMGQEEAALLRIFPVLTQPEPLPKSALVRQGLGQSLANAKSSTRRQPSRYGREPCREGTKHKDEKTSGRTWNNQVASKPLCTSHLGSSPNLVLHFRLLPPRSSSPDPAWDQTSIDLIILRGMSSQVPQRGVAKHWHM